MLFFNNLFVFSLQGRPMGIQLMDGSGNGKTSTNTPNKASIRQRVGTRPVTNGR
jgi:hypothetical protein